MNEIKQDPLQKSHTRPHRSHEFQPDAVPVDALRTVQSPGRASQAGNITQLQRIYGNRQTVQMLNRTPARPQIKQTGSASQIIQLDRLVEIHSPNGKDDDDFDKVRDQVISSIGTSSSGDMSQTHFAVEPTETLYIWGHMGSSGIGSYDFREIAGRMINSGFAGCKEIRLIGCNNRETPQAAPKELWKQLERKFKKRDVDMSTIAMPVIYATRGALQSSMDEGFEKGWWVGTKSEKEDKHHQVLLDIIKYAQKSEFDAEEYDPSWLDQQVGHYNRNIKDNYTLQTMDEDQQEKFLEKQLHNKRVDLQKYGRVNYPTLKKEIKDDSGMKKLVWNPDAWVSYSE